MRLFLAVAAPPSAAYAQVAADIGRLFPRARIVPPGNLHATLRFLGDADPSKVASAVAPVVARHPRCDAVAQGVGAFPQPRRARVAWAGLDCPALGPLAADLAAATPLATDEAPGRPFHAHVTLARFDPPVDARPLEAMHAQTRFGSATLDEVILFRSDLGPGGPRYTRVAGFPLGPPRLPP